MTMAILVNKDTDPTISMILIFYPYRKELIRNANIILDPLIIITFPVFLVSFREQKYIVMQNDCPTPIVMILGQKTENDRCVYLVIYPIAPEIMPKMLEWKLSSKTEI